MIAVQRIKALFDNHRPTLVTDPSLKRAEVALVLTPAIDREDPNILFIQRAEHKDDPWSGQMARSRAGAASPRMPSTVPQRDARRSRKLVWR